MSTPLNYPVINRIKELHSINLSKKEITDIVCKEFNMARPSVYSYFYRHKIDAKSHHKKLVEDKFFDEINSEIQAYLLGFFIADGYMTKEKKETRKSIRFGITLKEEDKYIIELFRDNVCKEGNLSYNHVIKGAIDRKPTYTMCWSSIYMGEVMNVKYNIHRNKTNDLSFKFPFETIDRNLIRHFIRGFFDGDGCVTFKYEKKLKFNFTFYSTSKDFLEQIGEIFKKELNVDYRISGNIKTHMMLYELRFKTYDNNRGAFIKRVYDYFYKDSEYFLTRKEVKFKSYLNTVLT